MRKKSHIALARYLVRNSCNLDLFQHKKVFYFGSIQPDLNPGMISTPHEFESSYGKLKETILELTAGFHGGTDSASFWRNLGIVLHYIADYFTFPHNSNYEGTLKDHCLHERDMKYYLRYFVQTPEAAVILHRQKYREKWAETPEDLFRYIEEAHWCYLRRSHSVEDDCRWIVEICSYSMESLLYMAGQMENASSFAGTAAKAA